MGRKLVPAAAAGVTIYFKGSGGVETECGGRIAWPIVPDLRSGPLAVRRFKSGPPPHALPSRVRCAAAYCSGGAASTTSRCRRAATRR